MCRSSGIEGTHSELKRGLSIRRCRYRGREKTDVQMQFAGAACNLRRWLPVPAGWRKQLLKV